jgi:hypothetical protein
MLGQMKRETNDNDRTKQTLDNYTSEHSEQQTQRLFKLKVSVKTIAETVS